jgi:hypothetical protein
MLWIVHVELKSFIVNQTIRKRLTVLIMTSQSNFLSALNQETMIF